MDGMGKEKNSATYPFEDTQGPFTGTISGGISFELWGFGVSAQGMRAKSVM